MLGDDSFLKAWYGSWLSVREVGMVWKWKDKALEDMGMVRKRRWNIWRCYQDHFSSQGWVALWRRAFWVPIGVRRSKWEQHLYRCCVIFIALLHLLGGISFSVNNQVNCTQTRSGTTANFFIVRLTQTTHPPPHYKKKKKNPSLFSIHFKPRVQLSPKTLYEGGFLKGREAERWV